MKRKVRATSVSKMSRETVSAAIKRLSKEPIQTITAWRYPCSKHIISTPFSLNIGATLEKDVLESWKCGCGNCKPQKIKITVEGLKVRNPSDKFEPTSYKATPKEELDKRLMDTRVKKTELEHYARCEVLHLRHQLADLQEVNYWKTESQTRLTHIADKCYEIKKLKQERLEPISEWDFKMMLFNLFPHSYGDDGECQLKPKHGFYIDGNLIAKEAVKRFGTRPIPSVEEIRKILTEEFGTIFPKHSEDYINNEVAIFIHKLMEGE